METIENNNGGKNMEYFEALEKSEGKLVQGKYSQQNTWFYYSTHICSIQE